MNTTHTPMDPADRNGKESYMCILNEGREILIFENGVVLYYKR